MPKYNWRKNKRIRFFDSSDTKIRGLEPQMVIIDEAGYIPHAVPQWQHAPDRMYINPDIYNDMLVSQAADTIGIELRRILESNRGNTIENMLRNTHNAMTSFIARGTIDNYRVERPGVDEEYEHTLNVSISVGRRTIHINTRLGV